MRYANSCVFNSLNDVTRVGKRPGQARPGQALKGLSLAYEKLSKPKPGLWPIIGHFSWPGLTY